MIRFFFLQFVLNYVPSLTKKNNVHIVVIKYNMFCVICAIKKGQTNSIFVLIYYRVTSSVTSLSFVPPGRVFSNADFHEDKSEKKEI